MTTTGEKLDIALYDDVVESDGTPPAPTVAVIGPAPENELHLSARAYLYVPSDGLCAGEPSKVSEIIDVGPDQYVLVTVPFMERVVLAYIYRTITDLEGQTDYYCVGVLKDNSSILEDRLSDKDVIGDKAYVLP